MSPFVVSAAIQSPATARRTKETTSKCRDRKEEVNWGRTRATPHDRLKRAVGMGRVAAPPHVGTDHARGPLGIRAFPHPARHSGMAGSR